MRGTLDGSMDVVQGSLNLGRDTVFNLQRGTWINATGLDIDTSQLNPLSGNVSSVVCHLTNGRLGLTEHSFINLTESYVTVAPLHIAADSDKLTGALSATITTGSGELNLENGTRLAFAPGAQLVATHLLVDTGSLDPLVGKVDDIEGSLRTEPCFWGDSNRLELGPGRFRFAPLSLAASPNFFTGTYAELHVQEVGDLLRSVNPPSTLVRPQ